MLSADRVCLVTGAASKRGIGRAIAGLFAEHGAAVAILDLDETAARLSADALPGRGHGGYACDVTDADRCCAVVAAILADFGRIDALVNNAGIAQPLKIMDIDPEHYDAVMDVNLRGTFQMCQAVIPHMRQRRRGAIVNIASAAAQRGGGLFGGPHYAAAKGGVLSLTKALARELGPDGVRVNAVCPSMVDTDIFGDQLTDERRAALLAAIPLGRACEPREVAGACLFLASDLSSYVTGATIDVNGGSHIH
jgi:NAD(P)-dependent dehydrogenase (short-subunit alcohol dehydrogenase family)